MFVLIQITLGQEDPEQAIQDFINQTNTEVNEYINPFVARIQDFSRSFAEEDNQLEQEYMDLSQELVNITEELDNGNPNVTNCLGAALEDAYAIYQDRSTYKLILIFLAYFSIFEMNFLLHRFKTNQEFSVISEINLKCICYVVQNI